MSLGDLSLVIDDFDGRHRRPEDKAEQLRKPGLTIVVLGHQNLVIADGRSLDRFVPAQRDIARRQANDPAARFAPAEEQKECVGARRRIGIQKRFMHRKRRIMLENREHDVVGRPVRTHQHVGRCERPGEIGPVLANYVA